MPNEQIFTWEGITLPSYWGGNLTREGGHAAMAQIQNTGASTITLVPNFFQADKFSNTVKLNVSGGVNSSESDNFDQVRQAIELAKTTYGLDVVLKPHLETDTRVWRAEIAPTDPKTWFDSYKAMMVEYAKAAQAGGAAMICVGTEMKSMTDPTKVCSDGVTYTQKWGEIVDAVRAVFSGKVTYAATYDEVTKVGFWNKVDFIGVDAYLPLSTSNSPTVDQMVQAWTTPHFNPWIRDTLYGGKSAIDYYKSLSEQYGKQVLFTEVGYRSMDGANKDPGVFNSAAGVDNQEQQDCYVALYKVMENYGGQWLSGAFLWSYHPFENPMTDPLAQVPYTDYTTQWKPANDVVTTNYSSPSHVTGLTWTGTDSANKLDGGYHNDTLIGAGGSDTLWGGAGDDLLNGGIGNDTLDGSTGVNTAVFSGTKASSTIIKNADGSIGIAGPDGTDLLRSVTFAQFSDQTVDLTQIGLPPSSGGTTGLVLRGTPRVDRLTGLDGADRLYGLANNDVLKGMAGNDRLYGGAGKDVLSGGAGQDVFVFNTKFSKTTNLDKIADFNVKDDTIWLDNALFKANKALYAATKKGTEAKPLKLASKFFTVGDHAKDANDYLIYDNKKGVLFYDADGSGEKAAIEIAILKKGLKMTYKDFFVV